MSSRMGPMDIPADIRSKERCTDGNITEIDKKDVGTPDEWIPRHPDLVRLTGRHPFNVEPPLPKLMEHGFITPAALHYVRNHGAVPKIGWNEHRLSVSGLVDQPTTFTMDDLLAMPARELPITLVCAGNRRKEENLVAQTIGFNWGAAGVSTSVWKGVLLRDVLLRCGIKKPSDGANHVCFVGVEKMPKGRYGTSINYWTAMDPACDVMLAYEQNGEKLRPDHGFPLRLIIPGYIGGRMIKWLNEISVTTEESDNFFHFNDNRVLPEHVTAEIANAEGWWYKPDYIINELNCNSAVAFPHHQEVVPITRGDQSYTIKGYCYTGGGRKVIRVEVSIDGGETWTLTKLTHPEKPTEYGRYWCWCFFEHEIKIGDLWKNPNAEILCRGWDAAMMRQPEKITWNVMGMMNNSYFRVKVHRITSGGMPALQFQHPTLAGPGNFGGWFEEKVFGKAETTPTLPPAPVAPPKPAFVYKGPPRTLDKTKYVTLPLERRIELTHDTRLFRFSLPSREHVLGLPVGQHLFISCVVNDKKVLRAYTPLDSGAGYVDFVIKVYFANVHPRFPEGGKLTQHLDKLRIGDTIQVKGPLGEYIFNTAGPLCELVERPISAQTFTHTPDGKVEQFDTIGFIAGGSGITPVLQTARALLEDTTVKGIKISILYANRTDADILCHDTLKQIDELPNVHVWYTLDQPPDNWSYSSGFIDEAMVRNHLPAPGPKTYIFCCGPPPMINFACKPNLEKVGHAASNVRCF
jgi:DMSO/TMAO reductase YedYZ molybdopterin-dependent catalytic subunit/NAD(P)H-flavin reductase